MATADELLKLAERIEAGGRYEQYALLIEAFALAFPDNYMDGRSGIGPGRWTSFKRMLDAEAYESAALTLVPEGCGWLAGWGQTRPDEPMGGARITRNARFVGCEANYDAIADAEAATPALALAAAGLRALAGEKQHG